MYWNIQLITNIIDLIHKFGMYSRFGYNRQICQGRILYMHSTNILYTRQNRLFIKYINNKRCLPLLERVLLGGKIMLQDYMFTIYSYTLHQLYTKSCKPKLHIYNNKRNNTIKYVLHMLYDISVLIIVEHMDYFFYIVESPTNRQNGICYVNMVI
jgi:hypothetical protein